MKDRANATKRVTNSSKFTVNVSDSGKFTINIQDSSNFTINISDCQNYSINQQDVKGKKEDGGQNTGKAAPDEETRKGGGYGSSH